MILLENYLGILNNLNFKILHDLTYYKDYSKLQGSCFSRSLDDRHLFLDRKFEVLGSFIKDKLIGVNIISYDKNLIKEFSKPFILEKNININKVDIWFFNFCIDDKYRGMGIGKKVIQYYQNKYNSIALTTDNKNIEKNPYILKMYQKLGFKYAGKSKIRNLWIWRKK